MAPRRVPSGRRWVGIGAASALVLAGLLAVAGSASADGPTTFSNTTSIAVPGSGSANQAGPANPYPSALSVSGMTGTVSAVTVTLSAVTHSALNDVDALLVSPSGANLLVLSDAGGASPTVASNATLTFSDSAASGVAGGNVATGTYKPTNNDPGDTFPSPAPTPSTQTTLAGAFAGVSPNGTWRLYVVDDAVGDVGQFAGGWSLTLTTTVSSMATATTVTTSRSPATTGSSVTFTASVRAGSSAVTSGSVQFSDGGTDLGSPVALSGDGTASLTTSALAEGTHAIRATYSGSVGFLTSNGTVTQQVDNQTVVSGNTFCNTGQLTVPTVGAATPYPSHISVSGLTGAVTKVTATLKGVGHAVPADLDVLLSSASSNLILLSDSGGNNPTSVVDLTFDDAAASGVPTPLATGTYRPTDDDGSGLADNFPSPAPVQTGATTLATFNGSDPNGTWSLWVNDDATGDAGSIVGGWCLTITTTNKVVATSDAGGPYALAEGRNLQLDGGGSTPNATYAWDLDSDGVADATTVSPRLTWKQLSALGIGDGPATHEVTLDVTAGSSTDTSTTALSVTNRAPAVSTPKKLKVKVHKKLRLRPGVHDPSAVDQSRRFTYVVIWKRGGSPQKVRGPAGLTLTHRYPHRGSYLAKVKVTDKDGGKSATKKVRIRVTR